MNLGRRVSVWALARAIRKGGDIASLRDALDRSFGHRSAEWRRELWREAAERAVKAGP
jgi:hypothetical protein